MHLYFNLYSKSVVNFCKLAFLKSTGNMHNYVLIMSADSFFYISKQMWLEYDDRLCS